MVQTCPSCNADIRDGAAFCSDCGTKIPATPAAAEAPTQAAAGVAAKTRFCAQCGSRLSEDAAFCVTCGSPAAQPGEDRSISEQPDAPQVSGAAQSSHAPPSPDSTPPVAVAAPPYQAPAPARRRVRIPFLGWLAFAGMVTAIFLPWLPGQEGYMNWIDMIRRGWQTAAIPWVAYAPFIVPAWSLMACLIRGWPGAVARVLGGFAALGFCVYLIAVSSEEIGVELLRVLGAGFWVFLGAGLVMLISGSYEGKRPA